MTFKVGDRVVLLPGHGYDGLDLCHTVVVELCLPNFNRKEILYRCPIPGYSTLAFFKEELKLDKYHASAVLRAIRGEK